MTLTTEQLTALTELANERFDEFDLDAMPCFKNLRRGQVRIIYDLVLEMQTEQCDLIADGYASVREAHEKGFEEGRAAMAAWFYLKPQIEQEQMRQHDANIVQARAEGLSNGWQPNAMQAAIMASTDQSIDDKSGISDDDWCGLEDEQVGILDMEDSFDERAAIAAASEQPPPKSDEKLTDVHNRLTANGGPLTNAQADAINRHNGVAGWRPGEEFGDPLPSAPSPQAATILGPEHVNVTPLRNPIGRAREGTTPLKPKTLEEADASELGKVVEIVRKVAKGGFMPTMEEWDETKPWDLPLAQTLLKRFDIAGWRALADMCGLKPVPHFKDREVSHLGTRLATLAEVIAELQNLSGGTGIMPTKDTYDAARPATWAKAMATLQRFYLSWEQLAEKAGLKQRQRGPQPQTA